MAFRYTCFLFQRYAIFHCCVHAFSYHIMIIHMYNYWVIDLYGSMEAFMHVTVPSVPLKLTHDTERLGSLSYNSYMLSFWLFLHYTMRTRPYYHLCWTLFLCSSERIMRYVHNQLRLKGLKVWIELPCYCARDIL